MKRFFLSIIIVFLFSPCFGQYIKVQNSKDKRIIDLDRASYPDTGFLFSTLYKSVKLIPLETNKSCLIGSIRQMQVIDNYILIMDPPNSLYVFDREGRFIRKIGSVGQGPGEYISIADFTIDRENKTVYIQDGRLARILKYDLATGKFIQSIKFVGNRNEGRTQLDYILHIGGNLYASSIFYNHSPDNYLLFTIDESTGKEKNNFLNVMEYNMGFSNLYMNHNGNIRFFSRDNGNAIFVPPMMKHIIEISKNGVFSLFEFKGKNMLTQEDAKKLYDTWSKKKLWENGGQNALEFLKINKYRCIYSYVEKGEWIMIHMGIANRGHTIVINKKTNEVCVYQKAGFDNLLYREQKNGNTYFNFGCSDKNGVYCNLTAGSVTFLQEKYKAGELQLDVIGFDKIMKLTEDDNPALLFYEFKD